MINTAPIDQVNDEPLAVSVTSKIASFEGFRKVTTFSYREDESGLEARREIVVARHAAAVVVYDPKLEKLIMVRQFRLGAQLATGRGMCAEIVAGLIDDGETPAETAKRELLEESGLVATRVEPLCEFLTSPGMSDELLYLFYAEADASELIESAGLAGETEQTFPFMLSLEEALSAVDENRITNGIAMLGIFWFARHRDRLLGN